MTIMLANTSKKDNMWSHSDLRFLGTIQKSVYKLTNISMFLNYAVKLLVYSKVRSRSKTKVFKNIGEPPRNKGYLIRTTTDLRPLVCRIGWRREGGTSGKQMRARRRRKCGNWRALVRRYVVNAGSDLIETQCSRVQISRLFDKNVVAG